MGVGKFLLDDLYKPYTNAYSGGFRPQLAGGIIGAGAGTAIGTAMPNSDPLTGAAVGGVAGALALPALGFAGAGLAWGASKTPAIMKGIGVAGEKIGVGAYKGAGAVAGGVSTYAKYSPTAHAAGIGARRAGRLMGDIFKYQPESVVTGKDGKPTIKQGRLRVSGKGKMLGLGIAGVMGANNIANDTFEDRQGRATGTRSATPNYLDNAGATGDLVFAMHQNRRG